MTTNGGDQSVITQYVPPGTKGAGGHAANTEPDEARRSWTSLLCCVRPQENGYNNNFEAPPLQQNYHKPSPPPYHGRPMCPPKQPRDVPKKCLVLDLDETLVHSSFKPVPNADYVISVEIDNKVTDVYVIKRPFVDEFMDAVGEEFEVVVFTASLAKYADPLLDLLDPKENIRIRLFRDSCCPFEGNYVKDLSRLGRDLPETIIVDNSPHSYIFQPENAVPIGTFIGDEKDRELLDLMPFLSSIKDVDDVRPPLMQKYPMNGQW